MASNPHQPISDDRAVDAVLKSIRSKLRANRSAGADRANLDDQAEIARLLEHIRQRFDHGQQPDATAAETTRSISVKSQDISRIDSEVGSAVAAHRQVGQLNPRLPGLHNRALQLVKKTMRRSLTWYTRPLLLFQGAVISALQHVSAVLQRHDNSLQKIDNKVDSSMSLCGQQVAIMAGELEALRSEVRALKEELHRTNAKGSESGDQQA